MFSLISWLTLNCLILISWLNFKLFFYDILVNYKQYDFYILVNFKQFDSVIYLILYYLILSMPQTSGILNYLIFIEEIQL